jgi:hypothetical protein
MQNLDQLSDAELLERTSALVLVEHGAVADVVEHVALKRIRVARLALELSRVLASARRPRLQFGPDTAESRMPSAELKGPGQRSARMLRALQTRKSNDGRSTRSAARPSAGSGSPEFGGRAGEVRRTSRRGSVVSPAGREEKCSRITIFVEI